MTTQKVMAERGGVSYCFVLIVSGDFDECCEGSLIATSIDLGEQGKSGWRLRIGVLIIKRSILYVELEIVHPFCSVK